MSAHRRAPALLAGDPPPALARFLARCQVRTYAPGSVLVRARAHSDRLFYLLRGRVAVSIEDEDGRELVLAYLGDGDFFGEIGLFDERRERSARVEARTELEVAQIGYAGLRELLLESPEIVFELLQQLAHRLRRTNRKAGDLAFTDTAGRVARGLLELAGQPGATPDPRGTRVRIPRLELARLAGCSREMVSRVLRALEEERSIVLEGRDIVVLAGTAPAPTSGER